MITRGGRLVVLALALSGLAGCGPARGQPAPPAAASTQVIDVHGVRRTFHVYRPPGLAGPAPLVVMLHGGFGTGTQAEQDYGWDAQARAAHFVVAYPDGLDRAWNVGGGCCGVPGRTGADDVGFITRMVARISAEVRIDRDRVYATGISNGGMLAYRLACDTRIFAAIGPDSATELGGCRSPAPVSVIHIHGTADHNIPYDGGTGQGFAHIDGPSHSFS
jgi:polyhydroxybutyrate depolymerase